MKKYPLSPSETPIQLATQDTLTQEQQRPLYSPGNTLIIAGPGSGKTRVLTHKVAHLLAQGVPPHALMLLTFTNKAAHNMVMRISNILGQFPKQLLAGTFHHVAHIALRKYFPLLGRAQNFVIMDRDDSNQMIKLVIDKYYPHKEKHFPSPAVIINCVGLAKNTLKSIESIILSKYPALSDYTPEIKRIASLYEKEKNEQNLVDFDDLLHFYYQLLQLDTLKQTYLKRFRHIFVDEFQDTNHIQLRILQCLLSEQSHITAVGDDSQSIYSFRGANIEHILSFSSHFPQTTMHYLNQNFRSSPEIVSFIKTSIEQNTQRHKKELFTQCSPGIKPVVVTCYDQQEEGRFIITHIKQLQLDLSYDNISVLFRADFHSVDVELQLLQAKIPYKKRGGLKFFEQRHIKDITAFLKMLHNKKDFLSFKRILTLLQGIGDKTIEKIWTLHQQEPNLISLLEKASTLLSSKQRQDILAFTQIVKKASRTSAPFQKVSYFLQEFFHDYVLAKYTQGTKRLDDIQQYINLAARYDTLESFIEDITLEADLTSREGEETPKITLSTIHQAKGLEWEAVFVIGLAHEKFPSSLSYQEDNIEEERRLFYVACSRAKRQLYLSYPLHEYTPWSGFKQNVISEFIAELPEELYEMWQISNPF